MMLKYIYTNKDTHSLLKLSNISLKRQSAITRECMRFIDDHSNTNYVISELYKSKNVL